MPLGAALGLRLAHLDDELRLWQGHGSQPPSLARHQAGFQHQELVIRLIHQRLAGDLLADPVLQARHVASDDVVTGRGDDLRFDVHRLLVVREPPTRQDLLPHVVGSGQKRRVIPKGQQIGDKVVFAVVEQRLALEFRLLDTGSASPAVGEPLQQGARLRFGLRQGRTVLRSICLAIRQTFCIHSVSPSTLHRFRRHPGGSPPACCRLLPSSGCHLPATQEAQGEQDRMKQRAYPVPGRHCSLNASGINMLEKREDHEGGLHPCDKTRQGTGGSSEKP